MILYNSTLVLSSLIFVLFYVWFVWEIYDKNDKLTSFIAMIPLTIILICWFTHVILAWNYFELMLKIFHQ